MKGFKQMVNQSGKLSMSLIIAIVIIGAAGMGGYLYKTQDTSKAAEKAVDPIEWHSYEEGVRLGKTTGKKIYIFFKANWCTYCDKMEKETFQKPLVASYLNENFIPVKVDIDRERKIASQFYVSGVPTSSFLSNTGEKISNLPGFIPLDTFLPVLRYLSTDAYRTMTFKDYVKSL
jgi:thioredoxin-related protein